VGVTQPVRTIRDKRPGTDVGDAVRQRIDVPIGTICLSDLASEPVGGDRSFPHQKTVKRSRELSMSSWRDLAIIGYLADVPQTFDCFAAFRQYADFVVACSMFQNQDVLGDGRAGQAVLFRGFGKRSLQSAERPEVKRSIPPLQDLYRLERMTSERLRKFSLERRASASGAKGAVAHSAAGAARDLRQLGRIEPSELVSVELPVGGESDVIDIEVESHSDGICSNQIFDVTGLIERNLRIARARTERAQHHGSTAALSADQLGDRIDLLGRERDDRRAARKPRHLLLARK